MRHGQTEMNVHLGSHFTPAEGYEDPLLYDTRLTEEGKAQAVLARVDAKALSPKPEVLITSPLTRALHTAELAFGESLGRPTIVEPTCSERIWLSSDVGRQPKELQQDFPMVNFDSLEDVWWHNNGSGDVQHILAETPDEFEARMGAFRMYLRQRPEKVLAVVTHFGVLEHMTGHRFTNCEIWSCLWEDGYCSAEHDGIQL
ncbi:TPA: hypothetical protein ACH3X2_009947 [Trebouxia sp. C0005]